MKIELNIKYCKNSDETNFQQAISIIYHFNITCKKYVAFPKYNNGRPLYSLKIVLDDYLVAVNWSTLLVHVNGKLILWVTERGRSIK